MAEFIIKIGNSPDPSRFQDGDIIHAINDRRIKHVHAEQICHIQHVPFNSDGLNPLDSLPKHYLEITSRYKFERVSANEVLKTDQLTGQTSIISNTPNAEGEMMMVEEYIARRKKHPRHRLFGTAGSEVWYGGDIDVSDAKLNLVWNKIEEKTLLRRVDYKEIPFSEHEKKTFLVIPVVDFDEAVKQELESSEIEKAVNEKGGEYENILQRRLNKVDYSKLFSAKKVADILDKTKVVDLRKEIAPIDRVALVTKKSTLAIAK